jgi:RimJ/RimL family protein N-acetyltransferase
VEAALAVKNYWLEFGFKEMTGFCLPDNEPSNAVMRKIGFERAGEALVNGKVVVNAYVLPGMEHCTVETTQFQRMGVDK